jgi:DNA polymerase I
VEGPLLLAVDGTGLLVRCSNAAARTGMSAPDGTPTGALTLFANSLASLVREMSPGYLVMAWDGSRSREWRRRICPGYKANRLPFPDKRPVEGEQAREFCEAAGIAQWCLDDFEADDMLAAASRLAYRQFQDARVVIASDDKDVLQLAGAGNTWIRPFGKAHLISAEEVELAWGVRPEYLPQLRALAGDRSDGIPGIPGVGPAIALRMLATASFRWPLPAEILRPGPERAAVDDWFSVMDLHDPPEVPEDHDEAGILDIRKTEWKRGNVLPVLEKYGMRKMAERYAQGTFW